MALLSVVVFGVLHTARLELMVVKNHGDRIQAHYLALAGIEKAKALIYQDALDRRQASKNHTASLYDDPDVFREIHFGPGQFSIVRKGDDGRVVYGINDEESRLNLNQAAPEELGKLNGITPDVAAAIVDWRDPDNNVSPGGAEAEYYASLRPPYLPRNGPFQTIRELLMVRGLSRELLFGENTNQTSFAASDPNTIPGLADVLTVDGSVRNVNAAGEDRVSIQNADEKTLGTLRSVTPEIAKAIVAYRGQHQFQNVADLMDVTAVQNQNQNQDGSPRRNAANQGNSDASGAKLVSEDLFIEIGDDICVDSTKELTGLVNINTASATVLACLRGLGPDLAQAIISYRSANGYFSSVAMLLKVAGLSREIFKQVAPRVTARSETFRIISEGKVTSSGATQRIQAIVHVGLNSVDMLSYREDL
jgi:competence ComEA-like helix-hairpin-helix protein